MKQKLLRLGAALLAALLLTGLAASGLLEAVNNNLSDSLYQRREANNGEIVVIGIDRAALEELGPLPWSRSVYADILNCLNEEPDFRPAVIGVDVLYVGETTEESDAALAEAAESGGNAVFAAAASFGTAMRETETGFYLDTFSIIAWDAPFPELRAVSRIGHINAMTDEDGIIRHALLYVNSPEGRVDSFARVIYERYCAVRGTEPVPLPETDSRGFFYLPYSAEPGDYYDFVSVADVLDGSVDPDYYAGKIVLIGPFAAGLQDEYHTSISHGETMYGIEIQANQIQSYLNDSGKREAALWWQLILLALVTFLLACVLPRLSLWKRFAACVLTAGVWLLLCLLIYRGGTVLQLIYIPISAIVLAVASVAVSYLSERREKRHISATFGRYVDPAVIRELLSSGTAAETLGGKLCEIAVLFVDIRGFTSMSENLPPTTVVEIINRYLTLTTDCIMRHHGTLDKFVGDCTMAFWNAPVEQDDYIYLACRAAMDMVEGAVPLGQELQEQYGRSVSFGVGVHVGPAVVGNIGAPRRMDFTAIGDTVNTASRLESNAPAGTVYISRAVADALGGRADTTSLGGSVRLKGKAEGFEVLTLDGLR